MKGFLNIIWYLYKEVSLIIYLYFKFEYLILVYYLVECFNCVYFDFWVVEKIILFFKMIFNFKFMNENF